MAGDTPAGPNSAPEDASSTLLRKEFLVLLAIAAVVGIVVSLAAWCFVELIYQMQRELYHHLPSALGYSNGPPLALFVAMVDCAKLAVGSSIP